MQLEIHWPEGSMHRVWYGMVTRLTDDTLNEDVEDFMSDVANLSFEYNVIIDDGVVTFVEKE